MTKTVLFAAVVVTSLLAGAGEKPGVLSYQYDASRGKIPTMETFKRIVDFIAPLGYNEFQLYGEYYFGYKGIGKDKTPDQCVSAAEVRDLDAYCRSKGIDFVPNQNSFGHMGEWVGEFPELAVLPAGESIKLSWGGSINGPGNTINPVDPRSLELIGRMYDQFLPCFSSKLFNVGCDETFEILYAKPGQTRCAAAIAEKGAVRVYFDFLLKIHELVRARGRRMMFWGDIILHRPELIPELPKDVVCLNWGYEANHPFEKQTAQLEAAGCDFYVAPGTSAWGSIAGRTDNMMANVDNAVTAGSKHGMKGVMLADWGDWGQPNPFLTSIPALIYTAHRVRGEKLSFDALAAEIDRLLGCRVGRSLLRHGNLYRLCGAERSNSSELAQWLRKGAKYERPKGMTDEKLLATFAERKAARADRDLTGAPQWVKDDVETIDLLFDALEACFRAEYGTIRSRFAPRYRELWMKQNRLSGREFSINHNIPE